MNVLNESPKKIIVLRSGCSKEYLKDLVEFEAKCFEKHLADVCSDLFKDFNLPSFLWIYVGETNDVNLCEAYSPGYPVKVSHGTYIYNELSKKSTNYIIKMVNKNNLLGTKIPQYIVCYDSHERDDDNIKAIDLINVIKMLCHKHDITSKALTFPVVVYLSQKTANREENNLKIAFKLEDNLKLNQTLTYKNVKQDNDCSIP